MLRIKSLIAEKVHGYIPISLEFNDDITFLTGSNGSGKTTALKLISSILQPNYDLLNDIEFHRVQLNCTIDNASIEILVWKENAEGFPSLDWEIRSQGKSNLKRKQKGNVILYPPLSGHNYSHDEKKNIKENLFAEFVNSDFYKIIYSFSSPILLGIDRKISGHVESDMILRRRRHVKYLENNKIQNLSYFDAQNAVIDYVSNVADTKKKLVENFKSDIFKALFKYVPYEEKSSVFEMLTESKIVSKRNSTIKAIKRLELENELLNEVEMYFEKLVNLQEFMEDRASNDENQQTEYVYEWMINRPHLERIEIVSECAENFQREIDKLDFPLNEISRIANSFFNESNKNIRIGANGVIHVNWSNNEITTRNLSSGEIQLIVILIHLVFCEHQNDQTVFVIDEPELSLHISWQEKFVDAIVEASPGTQFILATHSPAIISKLEYEQRCIYLENV